MAKPADSVVDKEVGAAADTLTQLLGAAIRWLEIHVFTLASLIQLTALAAVIVLGYLVRSQFKLLLARLGRAHAHGTLGRRLLDTISAISFPVVVVIGLWLAGEVLDQAGQPTPIIRLANSLLRAFIVIRIATAFIPNPYWASAFAWMVWGVAALNSVGLLDPTIEILRATSLRIGEVDISLWTVIKGGIITALLVWLAYLTAEFAQRRLEVAGNISRSMRLLISKILRTLLIFVAVLIGLTAVGVDLTAFAVFTGAVGIGVGLGLQRLISNLVAGFTLLADRSLKPGDVIEVETTSGGAFGVVTSMTSRYVSVRTRDGTEILIPNETLITNSVINWSYSDRAVRLKLPIGVSYDSDIEKVRELCVKAALDCPRILRRPAPLCLLKGFGDSSVDLELRAWIEDPEEGVSNVSSDVLLRVWHLFHEHGIEIPYPKRDVYLREVPPEMAGRAAAERA